MNNIIKYIINYIKYIIILMAGTQSQNITHSVLVDNLGNFINVSCADYTGLLLLRTMNPPITTRDGRNTGVVLNLNKISLDSFTMRRKAETLQYRKNQTHLSKKQQFANISKINSGSYYSSKDVLERLKNNLECSNLDLILKPPTNSGIHDYKSSGYYYDAKIPYIPNF